VAEPDAPGDGAPTATKSGEIIDFAGTLLSGEVHAIRQTSRRKSKKGIKLALDHGLL
jgi:hypothetical protein